MAGLTAFQQKYMGIDLLDEEEFTDFEARKLRYAILWAMYENTAYSKMHKWAQMYKTEYGLYKFTRNIYNPSYRIGEFWKIHLLGGKLDPQAGDGTKTPSALPILTTNEKIRPALARVWRYSNWQIQKDVLSLWTAVMGDGVLKVIDDEERRKVYLKIVSPATLKEVELDEFGNVKGYVIEERTRDPRSKEKSARVTYREVAWREGEKVMYQTYLNDKLYDWDGKGAEWSQAYGFVPMVLIQHNNVGQKFGWSELMPGLSKFREVDDLASKLSDQIRKTINVKWLFSGVSKPERKPATKGEDKTENNAQPGREEEGALYGPVGSDAKPLVAPIDIAATSAYIREILEFIEQEYPELNADLHNVEGDVSGRALRINRAPAESKALQRRPNYDDALVRAQKMALSIGGYRKYEGFEEFDLDSYPVDLEHSIGDRPVFAEDPLDDLEYEAQFWAAAAQAKNVGVAPLLFLKRKGWSDEEIEEVEKSPEYQAHLATLEAMAEGLKNPPAPASNRFGKRGK